jgi:hypothetical protein
VSAWEETLKRQRADLLKTMRRQRERHVRTGSVGALERIREYGVMLANTEVLLAEEQRRGRVDA